MNQAASSRSAIMTRRKDVTRWMLVLALAAAWLTVRAGSGRVRPLQSG